MKSLTRRLMIGAFVVCMGVVSMGVSPQSASAGLPSVPSIPNIPGVSGLSPQVIQALLQNRSAQQHLIAVITSNLHDGYVPKSATFNSLTGEVTIFSKRPGGGSRSNVISLAGTTGATVKSKKK